MIVSAQEFFSYQQKPPAIQREITASLKHGFFPLVIYTLLDQEPDPQIDLIQVQSGSESETSVADPVPFLPVDPGPGMDKKKIKIRIRDPG